MMPCPRALTRIDCQGHLTTRHSDPVSLAVNNTLIMLMATVRTTSTDIAIEAMC